MTTLSASDYAVALAEALKSAANPDQAPAMEAYMKNHFPFYGIKATERREVIRAFFRTHPVPKGEAAEPYVRALWSMPHREAHYAAMELLTRSKYHHQPDSLSLIVDLITSNSWWDTVDYLAADIAGTYFVKNPAAMRETTKQWNADADMWLVRTSIIFQLKYKSPDLTLLQANILPHLGSREFFIQKGIGWALRQVSKSNPEFVRQFIASYPLKPVSLREAKKYV